MNIAVTQAAEGLPRRAFSVADVRRMIDIGDYEADDRLFRGLTGWKPATDLAEGLARTLAFFRPRLAAYLS